MGGGREVGGRMGLVLEWGWVGGRDEQSSLHGGVYSGWGEELCGMSLRCEI